MHEGTGNESVPVPFDALAEAMDFSDTECCTIGHPSKWFAVGTEPGVWCDAVAAAVRPWDALESSGKCWVELGEGTVIPHLVRRCIQYDPRRPLRIEPHESSAESMSSAQAVTSAELSAAAIEKLSTVHELTDLRIAICTQLSDGNLRQILCSGILPNLCRLTLTGCSQLTEESLRVLGGCGQRFEHLDLTNCKGFTPELLAATMPKFTNLTSLVLNPRRAILTTELIEAIAYIPRLKTLELSGASFGSIVSPKYVAKLFEKLERLNELDVSDCNWVDDIMLEALGQLRLITKLDLSECYSVTDLGLRHIGALPHLQSLSLEGCEDLSNGALVHFEGHPKLNRLFLGFCAELTDEGMVHVGRIPELKFLHLGRIGAICDVGLAHLSGLNKLEELYLFNSTATNAGMDHVAKLRSLRVLRLGECHSVDSTGIERLGSLTHLEELFLIGFTGITEGPGVLHLIELMAVRNSLVNASLMRTGGLDEHPNKVAAFRAQCPWFQLKF